MKRAALESLSRGHNIITWCCELDGPQPLEHTQIDKYPPIRTCPCASINILSETIKASLSKLGLPAESSIMPTPAETIPSTALDPLISVSR